MSAAKQYNKLVEEVEFEVGDHVMIYNPCFDVQKGRKLITPWLGPYCNEKVLTSISYIMRAEVGNEVARVHVNRLRAFNNDLHETGQVLDAVFPDSRRIIERISADKLVNGMRQFKVQHAYSRGWEWISEEELPLLVVAEYDGIQGEETSQ